VLLHHGFGHADGWGGFPERLRAATGRTILAYSRLDCGRSDATSEDRPEDFFTSEADTILPALLESFGLRQACLYGHSDGATLALVMAKRHRHLVEAVIAEAPHVFAEARTIAGVRDMARRFDLDTAFRRKIARGHQHEARPFQLWQKLWLALDAANWSIERDVGNLDAPLLLVQGDNDPFGSLAHVKMVMARNPTARLKVVRGAGHSIHQTEASLPSAIATFLDALRGI
jgi:pimeloyl-ACP methyl ester carboxylesterase